MPGIVVGAGIKTKGAGGWTGKVVAIGAPPKGYRPKFMTRAAGDTGETVWIDWLANVLADKLAGERRVAYGYPKSQIQKLEVVN